MKFVTVLLFCVLANFGFSQTDDDIRRFGLLFNYDLSVNFADKVTTTGLSRKLSVGMYVSDKRKKVILFGGASFKFSRYGFFSPKLNPILLKEYSDNYMPIQGYSLDSLIGAGMNQRAKGNQNHYNIDGFTSVGLHFGIILNTKFRPSIQFYRGSETLEFNINNIEMFFLPNNYDLNYHGIYIKYANEVKLGISLVPKNTFYFPFSLCLNLGYKWLDYGELGLAGVSLSSLTNNHDFSGYNKQGKITLSFSIMLLNHTKGWEKRKNAKI